MISIIYKIQMPTMKHLQNSVAVIWRNTEDADSTLSAYTSQGKLS